ncbi:hypothetical protein LTR08_004261 [Meristemomyces frigidus]|nr:hypothetical protein LTR08_004261 [Meristemomyces frigidus]
MAIARSHIVTTLSVLVSAVTQEQELHSHKLTTNAQYVAALTALAAYALHSAHAYALPIPDIICALTVALPPLAGVALSATHTLDEGLSSRRRSNGQQQSSQLSGASMAIFFFFSIYEAVLATLAGVHVAPQTSLNCALRERWQTLFRAKHADMIQNIQDAFNCCGLSSPRDMAFPFPDAQHGSDACMVRFERSESCMQPWRGEERRAAVMLLIVPLAVFVWKLAILFFSTTNAPSSSWLPSTLRLPNDDGKRHAAIEYRDVEDVAGGGDEADSIYAEVTRLNEDSSLASRVESERSQGSRNSLWREHEQWADERE